MHSAMAGRKTRSVSKMTIVHGRDLRPPAVGGNGNAEEPTSAANAGVVRLAPRRSTMGNKKANFARRIMLFITANNPY
jgi:hypothetical protein